MHNETLEWGLLYALATGNQADQTHIASLCEDDFTSGSTRAIYRRMAGLFDRGETIDLVSATANNEQLLLDLMNNSRLDFVVAAQLSTTIREIKKATMRRNMCKLGAEIINMARDVSNEPDALVDQVAIELDKLRTESTNSDESIRAVLADTYAAIMDKKQSGGGMKIRIADFDRYIGGLFPGELTVLGARPAVGKSALALHISEAIALQGKTVQFFSREMSREQLGIRMFAKETGIDAAKLRTGIVSDSEWQELAVGMKRMQGLPVFINTDATTMQQIRAACMERKRLDGLGLVVIDYMQLISSTSKGAGNRVQEVSEISRQIKLLTLEFNIPVIALSQLSRAGDKEGRRPTLSDLRESGAIEQDADNVLFLHAPEEKDLKWPLDTVYRDLAKRSHKLLELIVAKQRQGPTASLEIDFDPGRMRFSSIRHDAKDETA